MCENDIPNEERYDLFIDVESSNPIKLTRHKWAGLVMTKVNQDISKKVLLAKHFW